MLCGASRLSEEYPTLFLKLLCFYHFGAIFFLGTLFLLIWSIIKLTFFWIIITESYSLILILMSLGPIFSHIISVFFKTLNVNVIDDDHIWFSLIIQEILLDNPVFIYFGINLKSNMPSIHEPTWHSFVSTGTFCSRSYEGNVLYRE